MRKLGEKCSVFVGIALFTVALFFLLLLIPMSAHASLPGEIIDKVGGAIGGSIESVIEKAISAISKVLFGDLQAEIQLKLVKWLVAHPDFANTQKFSDLNEYREYVTVISLGLVTLMGVVASMRFWLAGLKSSGSSEAVTAITRTGIAIGLLAVWPFIFHELSIGTNYLTHALLSPDVVEEELAELFTPKTSGNPIGLITFFTNPLMLLFLMVTKVGISALLAITYVGASLAIALWILPETSWVARTMFHMLGALFAWPVIWCFCFVVFALLSNSIYDAENLTAVPTSIIQPLIALSALYASIKLPMMFAQAAFMNSAIPSAKGSVQVFQTVKAGAQRTAARAGKSAGSKSSTAAKAAS